MMDALEVARRSRGQTRLWTDEEMFEMIEKINQGYTYMDVTDGTHIPISTLWTRVKGMYDRQMRPKVGAPKLLPEHMEEDIALFMKHCSFLRIPRSRQMLKDDIMHFVKYKNLHIEKLGDAGPGRSYLDRFANDWKELVKFHTNAEIFRIQNDPISMRDWVYERDNYTRIQILTKYFSSRRYIFVIEAEKFSIESANKQEFWVVMIYNAEGELFIPFMPHKRDLQEVLIRHFDKEINFFATDDGQIDRNCLCILMYIISLYLCGCNLKQSPVIYLAPSLAKHISLFMWDVANTESVLLQTIPQNIYRYFKTCNMGIFDKLTPKFKQLVKERFPDKSEMCLKFHFLEILTAACREVQCNSHLRNSCRRLRIVHVSPEIAQVEEEPEDDDRVP